MKLKSPTFSWTRVLIWFIFALSLGVFLRYLYFASYGLDFTDEGFYLNWYKYPKSYPAIVTFFGFIYALPYRLLGENIAALRVFNILTVLLAGAWCVHQPFVRMNGFEKLAGGPVFKAIIIFSLSTLSLLSLFRYSSPSYNTLAFIGCLLVAGALIKSGPLDESPQVFKLSFGLPLVSGIIVASLAKPTTGFVLVLVCLLYTFSLRRILRKWMILWLALCLVLTTCISIFLVGSPSELFSRVWLGKEWASLLDSGHNLYGLLLSVWTLLRIPPPLLVLALVIIFQASIVFTFLSHNDKHGLMAKQFLIAYSLALAFLALADHSWFMSVVWPQIGYIWLVVFPFSFLLLFIINKYFYPVCYGLNPSNVRPLCLYRLFLVLTISFGFGFGSNNALWGKIFSSSVIFISVAATFMAQLSPKYTKRVFIAFLVCVAIGELLLLPVHAKHILAPFRQDQPLFLNKTHTRVGSTSQLILSDNFSEYINNTRIALMRNGFMSGSPVLDFTGRSPGLIYAVGGRPAGLAWMIGRSKGSNALARAAIAKIPCNELYSSWVIVEPGGPASLDISILNNFDIDIYDPSRYEKVAHVMTPSGAGGFNDEHHQFIFKPLSEAGNHPKCTASD